MILLAHGSRGEEDISRHVGELLWRAARLLPGRLRLMVAFLQFNKPDLEEAVRLLREDSVKEIFILPLFLLPGRHLRRDIPRLVERLRDENPGMKLELRAGLGEQGWFFEPLGRWISAELPARLFAEAAGREEQTTGEEIMQASLALAEELLGDHASKNGERNILLRILHATGDPTVLGSVSMSPQAVERGIHALRRSRPVVVDVGMVKAGLNRGLLQRLGCPLYCAAEQVAVIPSTGTRVGKGMLELRRQLEDSLVIVGNAPTALLSVIRLVRAGEVVPSLVIGTPVGFIQALESKRSLMALGIPHITVQGTRGGSAMAVAAANALLEMAAGESSERGIAPLDGGGGI